MSGTISIDGLHQDAVSQDTAATYTSALDTDDCANTVVVVDTTGAATLTIEFSTTGDFGGEERVFTIDYSDAQDDQMEQFSLPFRFVRAKVDANLNDVEIVKGGV